MALDFTPTKNSKWDDEKWQKVLQYIRVGVPIRDACDQVRISHQTYYDWLKRSEILRADVAQAEASCKIPLILALYDKARKGDLKAIKFWLQSRYPNDWNGKDAEPTVPEEKGDTSVIGDRVERIIAQLTEEANAV